MAIKMERSSTLTTAALMAGGMACVAGYRLWRSSTKKAPHIKVVFFDVDDTLYQNDWKTADKLTVKMKEYTQQKLGLPPDMAYKLYKEHGTTLRGLQQEKYDIDVEDYLKYCHDIDRSDIRVNMELRKMLLRLNNADKWCFTASIREHAWDCITRSGLSGVFQNLIDVRAVDFFTKHHEEAYTIAMKRAGLDPAKDAGKCVFLDDSVSNIKVAKRVGWITILVGKFARDDGKPVVCKEADYHVDSPLELEGIFPHLFTAER